MKVSYASIGCITLPSPRVHEQDIRAAAESAWTFGFINMAGFTALTDAHGDREAVAVVDRFETIVIESLTADDQLVKTIGDAVMLRFASMTTAIAGTRRIFAPCTSGAGFPALRAGLHHGPAVARGQDWFGTTVNIVARVAAYGRGGQLLATRGVAETARRGGTAVTALGPVRLRNVVAPVELYDIDIDIDIDIDVGTVIDPVCRRVDTANAAGVLRHRGRDYWFCSHVCSSKFPLRPDRYATEN